MRLLFIPIIFFTFTSIGQIIGPVPRNLTPISFINIFCKGSRFKNNKCDTLFSTLNIFGDFPENWIKESDIDSLFKIINSKQKCSCMLNPIVEYSFKIPDDTCAEKGGFASQFIKTYRDKKQYRFGLFSCPRVDINLNLELTNWWKTEQKK
jgi:hypothetical protein